MELEDMSRDDMCFEIKRLTQKVQVLENDKIILQEEFQIAQAVNSSSGGKESENTAKLKEELTKTRNVLTMCVSKYKLVKTFLDLERKALSDIKLEVNCNTTRILKETDTKMNLFKETVLARESTLQNRYQKVNKDLYKSKEMAERYKVELHEMKDERRQLKKQLDNTEAELLIEKNQLERQVSSITSKIEMYQKEHAKEVKRLNDTMLEKENERKSYEDDLAKWKVTLKLRVEEKLAVDKKLEDMTALMAIEKEAAEKRINESNMKLVEHEHTCSHLRDENSMLNERLETLQSQQTKLLDTHDSLQNDFKTMLSREKSLRSELAGNSNDKGDMQRKLRSITEKVSTMEADHMEEMNKLKCVVDQKQELLDSALESREREGARAENLGAEVKRLEKLLAANIDKTSELKEEISKLLSEKLDFEAKISACKKEISDISGSLNSLRIDRDDALNQSLKYQSDIKDLNKKLTELERSLEELSRKKSKEESSASELERLKNELQASEAKIEQQNLDIRGLKDTVRRECEERTELMIEVSELKDQIKRLQRMSRGETMRSQSGGVDSSVQARQVFKNPDDAHVKPGMLRQLTGNSGSGTVLDSLGPAENTQNHENDRNWSKQRQSAQQNSGKSKRVSKYRS